MVPLEPTLATLKWRSILAADVDVEGDSRPWDFWRWYFNLAISALSFVFRMDFLRIFLRWTGEGSCGGDRSRSLHERSARSGSPVLMLGHCH